MNNMKETKKKIWEELITSTNMTHNSRKAWKIIKNLSTHPTSPIAPCILSENQLLINSRDTISIKPMRPVLSPTTEELMVYPFSEEDYRRGIATLKNNKAAGIDDVLVEQLNKDYTTPKYYRPISLLCHTYKLYDPEQNSAYHRRTSHQGTGRLST